MSIPVHHNNETQAAEAFSKQSVIFDDLYGNDLIIQYKRERVRQHILQYAKPGNAMLEVNCGSGEDALFFAEKGFNVHATDISTGMLEVLKEKTSRSSYSKRISIEQCSFTSLDQLKKTGRYDFIYSNFGGLNCTGELSKVIAGVDGLLKPGGVVTFVIISPFCLWETFLLFKGRFRTAFRRFFKKNGAPAKVEGVPFQCWYYTSSFVKKQMGKNYSMLSMEGLCSLVPPSYIEGFGEKYPRTFSFLRKCENHLKKSWPWKKWGDYFIISFRKLS
jgi:ubiquinone/menaquinone biosynthesis C-methylase UbiE